MLCRFGVQQPVVEIRYQGGIMEIKKIYNTPGIPEARIIKKADDTSLPTETFSPSQSPVKAPQFTAEEIGKLILEKGVMPSDVKTPQEFLDRIKKQIETARPEMEALEKEGKADIQALAKTLYESAADPHVISSMKTGDRAEGTPHICADGSIVISEGFSMRYLTAYSPSGLPLWKSKDLIDKEPAVDSQGNFYFAKNQNTVSYDSGGKKRWELDRSKKAPGYKEYGECHSGDCGGSSGVPAIDEKQNTMYMGEHYGKFIAVNKSTGAVKWIRFRPGMIGSCDPTLDREGNLFVHDDNGYVLSLKPDGSENWILGAGCSKYYPSGAKTINDSNTEKWMKEVGLSRRKYKYDDGDNFCVGTKQILVGDDQKVIFGMRDGRLMALNHDTGRVEMFFDTGEAIYSEPMATADGKVIVANTKGHIFCLDTKDPVDGKYGKEMKLLWDKELDEYASPKMIDSSGKIYVSSSDKGLIVYNPDGSQDWAAAIRPRSGIVAGKDGSVTMCDFNSVVTLQPLRERIKSLPPGGASSEGTGEVSHQLSIDDDGETVNVGGVILKKK